MRCSVTGATTRYMRSPDDLLTTAEVAAEYRVSRMTVRRWIKSGRLPALMPGGRYRFRRSDVEALATPVEPDGKTA